MKISSTKRRGVALIVVMVLLVAALWWWAADRAKLPKKLQRRLARERELAISAISCWEVGMLTEGGRLELRGDARAGIQDALSIAGIVNGNVTV